jgi:hypothetical protein
MPNNNRIYFALEDLAFSQTSTNGAYIHAHGVQSLGISVNYNLQPILELGQVALFQNLEQVPDVEMTAEKVLDGYPPLYCLATKGAVDQSLAGRANIQTTVGLGLFSDSQTSSSGTPIAEMISSGMFVSQVGYNFGSDGYFTETISLLGTSKFWQTSNFTFTGNNFGNADVPLSLTSGTGGVQRRQNFKFSMPVGVNAVDVNGSVNTGPGANRGCVLPQDIPGISASGTNDQTAGQFGAHVRSVSTSVNLGREPIYELGRRFYYYRYVQFPVQVTCDIEVTAHTGDLMNITETGSAGNGNNLFNRTIKIATDEGLFIDLGTTNKCNSVQYGGGDTGGGNLTITFGYVNWDNFSVYHLMDPSF